MRFILSGLTVVLFFLFQISTASAVIPDNDDISKATEIISITNFCSSDGLFNNIGATASNFKKGIFWATEGKDVWYKITATKTDLAVTVTGKTNTNSSNTLINPTVAIYSYETNILTEMIGSMVTENSITTAYKGGLVIGQVYYIRVSAENDNTGIFKLCLNNYNPPTKPGQDCVTASVLCSKETFTELKVSGAGLNNRETAGTCLTTESNSAWYRWTAANNGTLTFSITPTAVTDDIDWVLYDLGIGGDCSGINAQNAIRCASGSGITCQQSYYITGTNMSSLDLQEQSGCVSGQDGFVKYIDMIEGHVYALLVDNFSNGNNGFTISFAGTGEFTGPYGKITVLENDLCQDTQRYTFNVSGNSFSSVKWTFGEGASLTSATSNGPHEISYSSSGKKTVTLECFSSRGCSVISSYSFEVALKPKTPTITYNGANFCLGEKLKLAVASIDGASYQWSGPKEFSASSSEIELPLTSIAQAGDYKVTIKIGTCVSEAAIFHVPVIIKNPVASFTTTPELPGKFSVPAPITFLNNSKDASAYLWDFGDGITSSEKNPVHTYLKTGNYTVNLTAFNGNGCTNSATINNLVILEASALLIPNSFSPNGDGVNDEFNINISNLKKITVKIFNRYGENLFTSTNIFNSWDGNHSGRPVPVGAYYYVISGIDLFDREIKHNGSITLIR